MCCIQCEYWQKMRDHNCRRGSQWIRRLSLCLADGQGGRMVGECWINCACQSQLKNHQSQKMEGLEAKHCHWRLESLEHCKSCCFHKWLTFSPMEGKRKVMLVLFGLWLIAETHVLMCPSGNVLFAQVWRGRKSECLAKNQHSFSYSFWGRLFFFFFFFQKL